MRRASAHLLTVVAVLAVGSTAVGLVLVSRVLDTYRDGLEVTRDGAVVASTSADAVSMLAGDLSELTEGLEASLAEAQSLLTVAITTTGQVSEALTTNVADALVGTASIADRLANLVEAIERFIPGDSDSLAEDLRTLSDGLEPVPDQLRALGDQLDDAASGLTDARAALTTLRVELGNVVSSIAAAQRTLDQVAVLTDDVAVRAERALDRSSSDATLVRILVVLLGAGVVVACWAARRVLVLDSVEDHATAVTGADTGAVTGSTSGAGGGAGGGSRTHTP